MATMSARYTVIDGEVVAQERGGVRHQLVPDPLGSTVALYDDSGTKTDTFGYWPYGESAARTGTTTAKFQFVGKNGYYSDNNIRKYIRYRYLNTYSGIWFSIDPLWPAEPPYSYAENSPLNNIDIFGLMCQKPNACQDLPANLYGQCIIAICAGKSAYDMVNLPKDLQAILKSIIEALAKKPNYNPADCCKDASGKGKPSGIDKLIAELINKFCSMAKQKQNPFTCAALSQSFMACDSCCTTSFPYKDATLFDPQFRLYQQCAKSCVGRFGRDT
jgi:RHS repeat-associated protein